MHEKGGKRHEVPAHHNAEAYLDAYIEATGLAEQKKAPLFRTINKERMLTEERITRNDVLRMIKRRARFARLPATTNCHTFRATGITAYLEKRRHHRECPAHRGARIATNHQALRQNLRRNYA